MNQIFLQITLDGQRNIFWRSAINLDRQSNAAASLPQSP